MKPSGRSEIRRYNSILQQINEIPRCFDSLLTSAVNTSRYNVPRLSASHKCAHAKICDGIFAQSWSVNESRFHWYAIILSSLQWHISAKVIFKCLVYLQNLSVEWFPSNAFYNTWESTGYRQTTNQEPALCSDFASHTIAETLIIILSIWSNWQWIKSSHKIAKALFLAISD